MQDYSLAFGERTRGIEKRKARCPACIWGVRLMLNGAVVWKEKSKTRMSPCKLTSCELKDKRIAV